jgi:mRNA interferase MazF
MTTEARWNVCIADLEPAAGSEQGGQRPVLVISNNDFNRVMPVITVIPLTSRKPGRNIYPSEVLLKKGSANLEADSLVLCFQIRTISKKRIIKLVGMVKDPEKQQEIENAIKLHLDLPSA